MATLDDVFKQWQDVKSSFNQNYVLRNGTGADGWTTPMATDNGQPLENTWDRENSQYHGWGTLGESGNLDFRPAAEKAGFAYVDPKNVKDIADQFFGGDAKKAIEYRYGPGSEIVTDPRFDGVLGNGFFVKPTNPALASGELNKNYSMWRTPDDQPGVFEGIASGQMPGLALMLPAIFGPGGLSGLWPAEAAGVAGSTLPGVTEGGMSVMGGGVSPWTGLETLGGPMSTTAALEASIPSWITGGAAGATAGALSTGLENTAGTTTGTNAMDWTDLVDNWDLAGSNPYEGLSYSAQDIESLLNGTYSGIEQTAAQSASQLGDLYGLTQQGGVLQTLADMGVPVDVLQNMNLSQLKTVAQKLAGAGGGTGTAAGGSTLNKLLQSLGIDPNGVGGSLLNAGASALPSYLAFNYANNLPAFDTSKLESLYNRAGDTSGILGQYDINTGLGRNQLNSSLTQRGVSGSSFGDQALTNFNTQRDLGRGALGYQGLGTQGTFANNILNAQISQQKNKTDLLGRALGGVGNAMSGNGSSSNSLLSMFGF